jgi:hypothetical protein
MAVLNRIAFFQERRDEVPNQELARELAQTGNQEGIAEIAQNLWHENQNIQSDCLKVLYEIGYRAPELIADYVGDFLKLLKSKHNRMVWGSMLALSTVAVLRAQVIYPHVHTIECVMDEGSVITRDNGVKILAALASTQAEYRQTILPYLLNHLATCRPKDVPQHAENIVVAVDGSTKADFIRVLEKRMADLKGAQVSRVKKVIKITEKLITA